MLTWTIERGIAVSVAYGLLVPFSGLGNTQLGLDPEVAHAGHAVLSWSF